MTWNQQGDRWGDVSLNWQNKDLKHLQYINTFQLPNMFKRSLCVICTKPNVE